MTKICPDCKTVNSDSSGFCQNCGAELKESVEVSKNGKDHIIIPPKGKNIKAAPINNKSGGGIGGWWSRQSSGGKAAVGLVGLCCIGLILIIAIGGMFLPDMNLNNLDQNTSSINDKTFAGSGISFNYPSTWSIDSNGNASSDKVVTLIRREPGISFLTVSKESTKGHSLTYWMGIMQTPAKSSGNTLISTKNVTVDGSQGYQITWKYTSSGGGEQQTTFFIKNDTVYQMLVTTDSVSSIQSDINTILNSFKVT